MMDAQIMRHIVDSIESGAVPPVAHAAVRRWCAEPCARTLTYVRSSANHVFHFAQEGESRFLRLAHESERRPSAIEAELDFVLHLARAGIPVARPLPSAAGALIEDVSVAGQRYYAVVFEGLHGTQLELDAMNEARYRGWGRALARIHRASESFAHHAARPSWQEEIRALHRTLPPQETEVARVLTAGLAWLDALTQQDRGYGLIHGDFELDNLVWDGERAQALDFDGAVYTWYFVDIAVALQDVWLAGGAERDRGVAWFLEGYATERTLPVGAAEAIPRVLNLVRAVKLAQVLRTYATSAGGDSPDWLSEMRNRHQRWIDANRTELVWA